MGASDTNVTILGTTPAEQSTDPAQSQASTQAPDPVVAEPTGSTPSVVGDDVNAISGGSSDSQNWDDSEEISSSSAAVFSSSVAKSSASVATTESCDTKIDLGGMIFETCYSGYPVGQCASLAGDTTGMTAMVVTACPSGATTTCPMAGTDVTAYNYSSMITSCQ